MNKNVEVVLLIISSNIISFSMGMVFSQIGFAFDEFVASLKLPILISVSIGLFIYLAWAVSVIRDLEWNSFSKRN